MKFKKEDLSMRHIVKTRDGKVNFIGERKGYKDLVIYPKNYFGVVSGSIRIENLNSEGKAKSGINSFDIIAVKEYDSTSEAYYAVIEEIGEIDWDWEREEKTSQQIKIEELEKTINEAQKQIQELKGGE